MKMSKLEDNLNDILGVETTEVKTDDFKAPTVRKEDKEFKGEDKEWLIQYCLKRLTKEHIDYFIFGHRHLPLDLDVDSKARYINLGEWINYNTYAVFDGETVLLKKFEPTS